MSSEPRQHTPGPWGWEYSDEECTRPIALTAALHDVLTASDDLDGPRAYVGEADARLIAAAPDLLEACKAAIEVFRDMDLLHLVAFDQLDAAIAKAEGHADTTAANPPVAAQDAPRAIPGNTPPDPRPADAGASRGVLGPQGARPTIGGGNEPGPGGERQ